MAKAARTPNWQLAGKSTCSRARRKSPSAAKGPAQGVRCRAHQPHGHHARRGRGDLCPGPAAASDPQPRPTCGGFRRWPPDRGQPLCRAGGAAARRSPATARPGPRCDACCWTVWPRTRSPAVRRLAGIPQRRPNARDDLRLRGGFDPSGRADGVGAPWCWCSLLRISANPRRSRSPWKSIGCGGSCSTRPGRPDRAPTSAARRGRSSAATGAWSLSARCDSAATA